MYEFMTGIKYLNFIADIFGIGAEERAQRINKYADMFELTASLAQPVSSYSHGMKQNLPLSQLGFTLRSLSLWTSLLSGSIPKQRIF